MLIRHEIPYGARATEITLDMMVALTRECAPLEVFRELSISLSNSFYGHRDDQYVRAVRNYVGMSICYVREPDEIIVHPVRMLADIRAGRAVGDCDDLSLFAGTLLAARGFHVQYRAVFRHPQAGHFQHVFMEFKRPGFYEIGTWVPMDLTIFGFPRFNPADSITREA